MTWKIHYTEAKEEWASDRADALQRVEEMLRTRPGIRNVTIVREEGQTILQYKIDVAPWVGIGR